MRTDGVEPDQQVTRGRRSRGFFSCWARRERSVQSVIPSGAPRTVLCQRARGAEQARGSSGLRHGSWRDGDQLASLPNQCVERTPGKQAVSLSALLAGAAHAQRWGS
jgi:hypothetical protein